MVPSACGRQILPRWMRRVLTTMTVVVVIVVAVVVVRVERRAPREGNDGGGSSGDTGDTGGDKIPPTTTTIAGSGIRKTAVTVNAPLTTNRCRSLVVAGVTRGLVVAAVAAVTAERGQEGLVGRYLRF